MKVCPVCHTRYEDHVPVCLADGAALVEADTRPDAVGGPHPTGALRSGELRSGEFGPADPQPPGPLPVQARPSRPLWLLPPLVTVVLLAVGAAYVLFPLLNAPTSSGLRETDGFSDQALHDGFAEPPPTLVPFSSDPEGAEIWENGTLVCTTPCAVEHPAHVPLPRSFTIRAEGHRQTDYVMRDAQRPQFVVLNRQGSPGRVRPRNPQAEPAPSSPKPNLFIER